MRSAIRGGGAVPTAVFPFTTSIEERQRLTTPAFTRATTATTVDCFGDFHQCRVGEARICGARRVENLIQDYSEVINLGAYTTANTTLGASTVTFNSANASYYYKHSIRAMANRPFTGYIKISCSVNRNVYLQIYRTSDGTAYLGGNFAVTSTPKVICIGGVMGALSTAENLRIGLDNRASVGASDTSTTGVFTIEFFQLEEIPPYLWGGCGFVSGVSDYVSVGKASAPLYHGAGVDGVRYFPYYDRYPTGPNDHALKGQAISKQTLAGLYVEPQKTNYCTYSDDFTNAAWIKGGSLPPSMVVADNVYAPIGYPAWTIQFQATVTGVSNSNIYQTGVLGPYFHTFSCYLRGLNGGEEVRIFLVNARTNNPSVQAHCVLTTTWQRFQITSTAAANGADSWYWGIGHTAATPNRPQESIYAFGAQLEIGKRASSYIPTTSAAVTRNADVLIYTDAKTNQVMKSTRGAQSCVTNLPYDKWLPASAYTVYDVFAGTNFSKKPTEYEHTGAHSPSVTDLGISSVVCTDRLAATVQRAIAVSGSASAPSGEVRAYDGIIWAANDATVMDGIGTSLIKRKISVNYGSGKSRCKVHLSEASAFPFSVGSAQTLSGSVEAISNGCQIGSATNTYQVPYFGTLKDVKCFGSKVTDRQLIDSYTRGKK